MKIVINDSITLEIEEPAGLKPLFINLVGSDPANGDPISPSIHADGCWINMKAGALWGAYKEGRAVRVVHEGPDFAEVMVYELVFAAFPKPAAPAPLRLAIASDDDKPELMPPFRFVLADSQGFFLYTATSADDYPVLVQED